MRTSYLISSLLICLKKILCFNQIEEQVKAWQGSSSTSSNTWSQQQPDWVKLVYSSLIYISGSSGGNCLFLLMKKEQYKGKIVDYSTTKPLLLNVFFLFFRLQCFCLGVMNAQHQNVKTSLSQRHHVTTLR
jgi:hypothetical protein